MATRTRSGNRVTAPVFSSKSDYVRSLLKDGMSVADSAKKAGIGYAFAYGIAKRAGLAETAANRRKTRAVAVVNGIVTVQTTAGPVVVHPDGRVVMPKKTRSTTKPA